MNKDVGIRVSDRPLLSGYLYSAYPQIMAFFEWVNIKSKTDPDLHVFQELG